MDPLHNPFAPGAGTQPPELAGRDVLLDAARLTLERIRLRRPAPSQIFVGQIFVGLRGVGKTVLLSRVKDFAAGRGSQVTLMEVREDRSLPALPKPALRRTPLTLDTREQTSERTKRAPRVLRSFLGKFTGKLKTRELTELGPGFEPERRTATMLSRCRSSMAF